MTSDLRMPAETAAHERTVMCWPARHELYGDLMPDAERAHAEVATTIARFEPVTMIAAPGSGTAAAEQCGGAVEVVELPLDDSWFRDTGPIYVVSVPMVLEGGSIAVDGHGTLVTTEQCLLHPSRNPTMTRTAIEDRLRTELGVTTIVWLPHGLALDDDTDGHVDNVAAFARPGTLVVQGCDDPAEEDWLRCNVNRRSGLDALDATGRPLAVVEIPVLPYTEVAGRRVAVPYLNYYVGNGFVVVPVCGHDADADMVASIAEQYPDRDTIALDVGAILAYGGGGIHCITQQVPAVT
jgi:agmatine deiminase